MDRLDLTKIQVAGIALMLRDELDEDERLYLDTLEGETDLFAWCRRLLEKIEDDEGAQAQLAEQIADRTARKQRAAERVKSARTAIMALLECAKLDKLVLPEATISVRDVPPKPIVTDEAAVPEAFKKATWKPDMAAIKAGLESGATIEGVSYDNGGQTLTVRRK